MKSLGQALGLIVAFGCLFALGFTWRDFQRGRMPSAESLGLASNQGLTAEFEQSFQYISNNYFKPVDSKKLKFAAVEGMMGSLGDPHTVFLEPRDAEQLALETRGNYAGIGCRLSPDPIGARVEVVFEGSPAMKAGLQVGDMITGVESKSVLGADIDEIVGQIRGPEGTKVRLQILRKGSQKPMTVTVGRARIETPTVEASVVKDTRLGRLVVSGFSENTPQQFVKGLAKLEKQNINGLIIDLRGNPGGLLESAAALMGLFVDGKTVVKMKGRDGSEEVVPSARGVRHRFGYKIVALMNEDSASAAEIFAGCLRDYGFAKIVGEHSYGKASVQNLRMLVDGASVKITTAKYFLPSTPDISRKVDEDGTYISGGLQPDVKSTLDPEAEIVFGDPKSDTQLQKAIQVLKGG